MVPDPQNPAAAGGEQVLGIIPHARRTKMFGLSSETFTIVITDRRMLLAQMTLAMLKAAVAEA